jgi:hypothetical protein
MNIARLTANWVLSYSHWERIEKCSEGIRVLQFHGLKAEPAHS